MSIESFDRRLRSIEFMLGVIVERTALTGLEAVEFEERGYRRGYQVGRKQRVNGQPFDVEAALSARRKRRPHRWLDGEGVR